MINILTIDRLEEALPEIQNTFGVPPLTHLLKNSILSFRSMIHEASGFSERNPFSAHSLGTLQLLQRK